MKTKDDCLFCKIVAGEVPSTKVYEDDIVYAFDDINPMMPVHTLVIPKEHYDNIADDLPAEVSAGIVAGVQKVAEIKGIKEDGFRVCVNTGKHGCQAVNHVHFHVMGGAQMDTGSPLKKNMGK